MQESIQKTRVWIFVRGGKVNGAKSSLWCAKLPLTQFTAQRGLTGSEAQDKASCGAEYHNATSTNGEET